MVSPNKIFRIPCNNIDEVLTQWVELLSYRIARSATSLNTVSPNQKDELRNGLSPKRREVLVYILKEYIKLTEEIPNNPELVDKLALNADTKRKIRELCHISPANFNGLIGLFRSIGIIRTIGGIDKIKPSFIPDVSNGSFLVSFYFDIAKDDNVETPQ